MTAAEYKQRWLEDYPDISYGYCCCGCGEKTGTAEKTKKDRGWVKGEPKKFIHNHHSRHFSQEYVIENKGFSSECWISQRSRNKNGYTYMRDSGKNRFTHRVYYERKFGFVPHGKELHHLCSQKACCNPDHLQPISKQEHQKLNPQIKLTETVVEEIAGLLADPTVTQLQIAKRFNLSQDRISHIWQQCYGKQRPRAYKILSEEQKIQILKLKEMGYKQTRIAKIFGVADSVISRVVNDKY